MTITLPSTGNTTNFDLNPQGDAYQNFVAAQFLAVAVDQRLNCLRGLGWQTDFTGVGSIGEVICSASYKYNGAHEFLLRIGNGVAFAASHQRRFAARLAATSEEELDAMESVFRVAVPELGPEPERQEVAVRFWASSPNGQFGFRVNKIAVPTWSGIAANYAGRTRVALEKAMTGFAPGRGGRLMLWTGEPGTGKTYAIRALAWEWRHWCDVHYVIDPETVFGSATQYLVDLLTPDPMTISPAERDRWRLVVLEDTGELLAADAKSRTGQALSRLLNIVDGLLGQGSKTLVLVTTNEESNSLHPAVARPGRCASRIDFEALSGESLSAWRETHGLGQTGSRHNTVAELYAEADGEIAAAPARRAIGFAP